MHIVDHLTLSEVDYFVSHAYSDKELEAIANLIKIYRSLSGEERNDFQRKTENYFRSKKEQTAKNVYGNYRKSIEHTISLIGWCNGFSLSEDFTLNLDNTN